MTPKKVWVAFVIIKLKVINWQNYEWCPILNIPCTSSSKLVNYIGLKHDFKGQKVKVIEQHLISMRASMETGNSNEWSIGNQGILQ